MIGSRQERRETFQPATGPAALLSDDAKQYTEAVPQLQRAAAADATLNGEAALERGHQGAGNEAQRLEEAR
jgi:hypothetical protein